VLSTNTPKANTLSTLGAPPTSKCGSSRWYPKFTESRTMPTSETIFMACLQDEDGWLSYRPPGYSPSRSLNEWAAPRTPCRQVAEGGSARKDSTDKH